MTSSVYEHIMSSRMNFVLSFEGGTRKGMVLVFVRHKSSAHCVQNIMNEPLNL
jgi:hypothetical protein